MRFFDLGPGVTAAVAKAIPRRPGWDIPGRRDSWLKAPDEPHPTLMRTPAAPLRRTGRLCRGQRPGRSRYAFVPDAVAIQSSPGSPREGASRSAGLTGGAGRRAIPPGFWPAPRRGSGGPWDDASASSPLPRDSVTLSPYSPDPPPRRGRLHRGSQGAGAAGVPSNRSAAGATAEDTRFGLTVHGQRVVIAAAGPVGSR